MATIRVTHSPLNTQQPKQKCNARIPTTRLIHNAFRTEDVACGVHFRARRCGEKDDNDN